MKSLFLTPLMLLLLSSNSVILTISIDNYQSGEAYLYNTITHETDTFNISGNSFSMCTEDLKEPTLFYLMFKDINNISRPLYFILSNQETHIKFNDLTAVNQNSQNIEDIYPNRPVFLSDPNNNGEFYKFFDSWKKFYNNVTKPELDIEGRKKIYTEFINESENIIKENKNKHVSALIIDFLINNNLIQLDRIQFLYSCLEPDIQESSIGQKVKNEAGFETQTFAPKFTFRDYYGNSYSLDSLKGNKVLLHFWSSSCAPCIKEIPLLLKLAREKNNLVIINISLDTDKNRWITAMEQLDISDMINFCDFQGTNGRICIDYHIKSIPAIYLIDEKGNILLKKESVLDIIDSI